MDNRTAIALILLIFGFFALDQLFLGWDAHLFLAQKFVSLIDAMAIWR